ncbi:MAG: hypothetical protein AAB153_00950, partial [Pseudomonadota bacterium]
MQLERHGTSLPIMIVCRKDAKAQRKAPDNQQEKSSRSLCPQHWGILPDTKHLSTGTHKDPLIMGQTITYPRGFPAWQVPGGVIRTLSGLESIYNQFSLLLRSLAEMPGVAMQNCACEVDEC